MNPHYSKDTKRRIEYLLTCRTGRYPCSVNNNFLEQPIDDFNLTKPEEVILYS